MQQDPSNKKTFYYGSVITAVCWLIYFFTTSASSYGTSVVSTKLVLEQGWEEQVIGLSSSMLYTAVAIFSVLAGLIEKKAGCRKAILLGSLVGLIAHGALAFFPLSPYLFVALFFPMGICSAICGMTAGPALITSWFREKRASAMAIFYTAGSIGGFVMPLIARFLSDISVRLCFGVYAVEAALAFLIALVLVRDHPEGEQLPPVTTAMADAKSAAQLAAAAAT
ncbi:MAG: MFS transporter, partial [Firmicutes bacterium]|nr:MFS transporter [Bacillota bacterium]